MKKRILFLLLASLFLSYGKAQTAVQEFDTLKFNKQLAFANWLSDYEYYAQLVAQKAYRQDDKPVTEWFSYLKNSEWHTVGGTMVDGHFSIAEHLVTDSIFTVSSYSGPYDSAKLNAAGKALSQADAYFQLVRDSSSIYFSSFVHPNPDETISIWYLPAFQPSGQAIYGCEWEYVFDKSGKDLLQSNTINSSVTGVWIGQPREVWLNYRTLDSPSVGSLFFAISFRDYFTRLRIATRNSTSTLAKDANGVYRWTHKMK